MALPNPYSPGSRPAYLAGRGRELALIGDLVGRVQHLGRSGGPLLAFHGPRGTGKTSLLRRAQSDARDGGLVTAWVTGRDDSAMVETLAKSLTESIRALSLGERAKGLLGRLDQVQVELGVPGAKVGAQIRREANASAALREVLEDAGRLARNHEHHGLVLFVDEFQEARQEDRKSLLIALQEFDGDLDYPCPVGIIAAGLPSIHTAVTEAATFGERSRFVELHGLTPVATAEALRLPAEDLGVRWDDAAIAVAIEGAGGYPHKVQVVGACAWEHARPEDGAVIGAGDVRGAMAAVEERMADLYLTRWAVATTEQRRFLSAMAAGGTDETSREAIAATIGVTSKSLSRPRQELMSRGIIEPAGRGLLRFTIPGFGDFVRRQESPAS